MSKRSFVERLRILISRVIAGAIFGLLLVSESAWDLHDERVAVTLFTVGVIMVALGSMGRLWCAVYIAGFKTEKLITEGPYSAMRNPLYFFSLIGALGVGFASETLTVPLLIAAVFAVYYPFVIKSEEAKLRQKHTTAFDAYCAKVPRFFPDWKLLSEPTTYSVNPKVFRGHIASALWFVWIVGILEIIESLHELHVIPVLFRLN